ncbi:MAG: acyltransferase [Acidimicrobiales bacterium]
MSGFVHPSAVVEDGAILGDGVKVWHFAHIRQDAKIGSGTQIGKSCYVDMDVSIGARCKVQNFVSIYHGVKIEDDVFVGPSVTFTNDKVPRAFGSWKVSPTLVGKGVSIGANATVVCGIELGDYCMVGAGAVVTRSVDAFALVVGSPARQIGWVCLCGERVDTPGGPCSHLED